MLTLVQHLGTQLFWQERSLYVHEHSNRFYSTSAYFVVKVDSIRPSPPRAPPRLLTTGPKRVPVPSQVFFDLVPLRLVPTGK